MLGMSFSEKVKLLKDIDAYTRQRYADKQVSTSLSASWQAVQLYDAEDFALLI